MLTIHRHGEPSTRTRDGIHVLIVLDSLQVGGAERHAVDLAVALKKQGYAVVVAAASGGALRQTLHDAHVAVRVMGDQRIRRRISLRYAWWLHRVVRQNHVDLIHTHMYASLIAATLAARNNDPPLIHTEHSEAGWRGPAARAVGRATYRQANHVIAVSQGIAQRLCARDGLPAQHVTLVPCAVPAQPPRARATALAGPSTRVVGVIARLQPEKGIGVLLDAASLVQARVPDSQFVVVGDGPLRPALQEQVRTLRLDHRVQFLGNHPEARALLPAMDLLVVPSLSEGGPLVVLEAMTAGVPIVATRVGGIPEQLRHAVDALLVPPQDPVALAAGICRMLLDPSFARRCARAAHERVTARFSYDAMLEAITAIYASVLCAPGMPSAATPRRRPGFFPARSSLPD